MPRARLDLDRIRAARKVIDPVFVDTPAYVCEPLGQRLGCEVTIKLETANPVRCFKGRGSEVVLDGIAAGNGAGAVCASAGNLGQALAYSGRRRGIPVTVVTATSANQAKVDRIQELDAELVLVEGDIETARAEASAIAEGRGIRLVEDSLDLDTCEGAATIGLELVESSPDLDVVLVALGGGAMASGVGHVFTSLAPDVEVVCIQPHGAPAMTRSWHRRQIVSTDTTNTIADGVAGRHPIPEVLTDLLAVADDAVLVHEHSITAGMRLLRDFAGLIVEPSAALGVAALLENPARFADRRVATIICGSNVDLDDFARWTSAPRPGP